MITLGLEAGAFARGGNRLCFVDPRDCSRCIKVLRRDRLPEKKRKASGFPRSLKPTRFFDDNWQELKVYQKIQQQVGEQAYELIPRCFGSVDTEYGSGVVTEMITDDTGLVSLSLKQVVWQQGKTPELMAVVDRFIERWQGLGMPSRNLLLHNIVVQYQHNVPQRLVVIDGLGWPDAIPLAYVSRFIARHKAGKKARRLYSAIDQLLANKANGASWGFHGWLEAADRHKHGCQLTQNSNDNK